MHSSNQALNKEYEELKAQMVLHESQMKLAEESHNKQFEDLLDGKCLSYYCIILYVSSILLSKLYFFLTNATHLFSLLEP